VAAINIGTLRSISSGLGLSAENVTYNFGLIRTAFNNAFNGTTGHTHDGTDSPAVSSGITGWSFDDAFLKMLSRKGGM